MNLKERINKNRKLQKIIAYGISGVITTVICFVTFKWFLEFMDYIFAFTLSWLCAVTFAYLAMRKKVYNSKAENKKEKTEEYIRFVIGRVITYIVNLVLLIIAVEMFKLDEFYSNMAITIIVIILNYFVGDIMINKLKRKGKKR
ncbi:MAG: GtrA family protein [Clostridia bacterium]|nr:GtrA family protein [Clostridia bacterium]